MYFAIVACFDIAIGRVFSHLEANAKGGFTYRDNYISHEMETDILLCGSSRCVRHYNPEIISDSLGLSCYNVGQMGNGILLCYGRLLMIEKRKKPRIIVCDITPSFDLLVGDDNHRYLTWLKAHYDSPGIAEIFETVDGTEKYKMQSQLYRYNSRIVELLTDCFFSGSSSNADGFSPLKGDMDKSKIRKPSKNVEKIVFDPVKLDFVHKFIDEAKGSRLIFVVSPSWYGMDTCQFEPLVSICKQRDIEFFDYSNDPKYVHNDRYFKDGSHMNARGADEFTRDLTVKLKELK